MARRGPEGEYYAPPEEYGNPREFSEAPLPETLAADRKKEYEYETGEEDVRPRQRSGRTMRSLLIQAAGLITGAILVMNSFGMDFLGSDGFFAKSTSPVTPTPAPPATYDIDPMPSVDSKWPTKVHIRYHLTYMVDGSTFDSTGFDDEAVTEAKAWCASVGADFDTKVLVKAKNTKDNGFMKSDDAVFAGDADNKEAIYLMKGELWWDFERDEYYEVYAAGSESGEVSDDSFPILKNLDPDLSGEYAWNDDHLPEEYVRFLRTGDTSFSYLHKGAAWDVQDPSGKVVYPSDASYDSAKNTLTLTDFTAEYLDVNLMGNGFKIKVEGDCHIDKITIWGAMYGGSVTFTGNGKLTVNENRQGETGLYLNCEYSESCLMVDREVTLEVFGEKAIIIDVTEIEEAIYYLKPIVLTGGKSAAGDFVVRATYWYDGEGNVVKEEIIPYDDVYLRDGKTYYCVSVVGDDGQPSDHVLFKPSKN